ncbi:C6 zinc finger domain protein, partial [Metarhizium majus ARSEF 297]
MMSFPITKRKRATRAKFAKVRTGCVTWFCGGYEPILNQSKSPVKQTFVTPRSPEIDGTSSPEELDLSLYDSGYQLQLPENLSPPESIDSQASSYGCPSYQPQPTGHYFTVPDTRSTFDDTFWTFQLPRLAHDNPAIRYANMAVHALLFAKGHTLARAGKVTERDHYGEALSCYGIALQEARQATTGYIDLREAVICCMFFVIFETINGDREAAQAHLQSGQRILEEIDPEYNGAEGFRKELRNVLQFLAQQARESGLDEANQRGGDEGGSILDTLMV